MGEEGAGGGGKCLAREGEEATFLTPSLPPALGIEGLLAPLGFEGLFKNSNNESSLASTCDVLLVKAVALGRSAAEILEQEVMGGHAPVWCPPPLDLSTDLKEGGVSGVVDSGCAVGSYGRPPPWLPVSALAGTGEGGEILPSLAGVRPTPCSEVAAAWSILSRRASARPASSENHDIYDSVLASTLLRIDIEFSRKRVKMCSFPDYDLIAENGASLSEPQGVRVMMSCVRACVRACVRVRACVKTKQAWYADDAAACGDLTHLRSWWDQLVDLGPIYGYHPNTSKTWLFCYSDPVQPISQSGDCKLFCIH